jgi:hypothetical protein
VPRKVAADVKSLRRKVNGGVVVTVSLVSERLPHPLEALGVESARHPRASHAIISI